MISLAEKIEQYKDWRFDWNDDIETFERWEYLNELEIHATLCMALGNYDRLEEFIRGYKALLPDSEGEDVLDAEIVEEDD